VSRKICVVTGTRADYGLLRWIIEGIRQAPGLELQLIATGMHLSPEFGLTYREIENDGFRIDAKVEMLLSSDTWTGLTKAVGLGIVGLTDALGSLEPDIVVVLGDRFEILAAAEAALFSGVCIAHISGGEVTEGALDDTIRHCITKMARYHFVAAEPYRQRVIQLGEQPDAVFNVGDPGLDNIERLPMLSRDVLGATTGLDTTRNFLLVTYHPTTTGDADPAEGMRALLDALDEFPALSVLITKSNADAGGRVLNTMVDTYAADNVKRVVASTSLGRLNYLSAMRHCSAVVGNSSSGIVEAPAMGVPTVNVGSRQQGRLKAGSVIDCAPDRAAVVAAIKKALSAEFKQIAAKAVSLYGNCDASTRIVKKLGEVDIERRHPKRFYDWPA
jgi:UDP-N-acetylglucosamine 2-epimerase (non-hydrolysing)/GDP/UDP-N,N'-diacetylbacillosamine 2-epimerase (hydrolysing)